MKNTPKPVVTSSRRLMQVIPREPQLSSGTPNAGKLTMAQDRDRVVDHYLLRQLNRCRRYNTYDHLSCFTVEAVLPSSTIKHS